MSKSKRAAVGIFGIVPIAICNDLTITRNELRAYIAISSYQGSNGDAWPGRELLAKRAGLIPQSFTEAATSLIAKGWIERRRSYGKKSRYVCLHEIDDADIRALAKSQKAGHVLHQLAGKARDSHEQREKPAIHEREKPDVEQRGKPDVYIQDHIQDHPLLSDNINRSLIRKLYLKFPEGKRPWQSDPDLWKKIQYYKSKGSFSAMVLCVQEYQEEQTG